MSRFTFQCSNIALEIQFQCTATCAGFYKLLRLLNLWCFLLLSHGLQGQVFGLFDLLDVIALLQATGTCDATVSQNLLEMPHTHLLVVRVLVCFDR